MLAANCPAGSDADNTKDDAKATFNSAKDTVKDVVQQSKDAVQAGTQEAHEVATNVVYAIKALSLIHISGQFHFRRRNKIRP